MSIFRVSKAEAVYFDLFIEFAGKANATALLLEDLVNNYTDVHNKVEAIKKAEHDCDMIVHTIMHKLNTSFVTPLDREDIDHICHSLDNIVDHIEAAAQAFVIYNISDIKEHAKGLVKYIVACSAQLMKLMDELKHVKKSQDLKNLIIDVNSIENEGDVLHRKAISELFLDESKAVDIIKWKDIYDTLENCIDACEDVANIVEGVVMKHA